MSDFLQHLQILQEQTVTMTPPRPTVEQLGRVKSNIIILDLDKDPDPNGLHNMPLSKRLQSMGWN